MAIDKLLDGRVKVRQLVLLMAIDEHGSLLAAAEAMHVTQPSVSRSLHELEKAVGSELFIRGPRGVKATRSGEVLLEHARAVVGHLSTAASRITALETVGLEPVTVCTNLGGTYSLLLPRAIGILKRRHPRLTVSVIELVPEHLETFLRRGEVDMFVGRLGHGESSGKLRHIQLYEEPVGIVAREGHPLAAEKALDAKDLMRYTWILPNRHTQPFNDMVDWFDARGLGQPEQVVECSSFITLRTLLLETDAVAPAPMLVGVREPGLTVLDIEVSSVPSGMGVMVLEDRVPSPSAQLLERCLIEAARHMEDSMSAWRAESAGESI